ncbi:MAG: hypothetical protein K1X89_17575 [Myxococcaceae bacterium]|nr:hypothetical protein [Myxococcaceae bacterium]
MRHVLWVAAVALAAGCGGVTTSAGGPADSGAHDSGMVLVPGDPPRPDAGADAGVDAGVPWFAGCVDVIGTADASGPFDAGYVQRTCSERTVVLAIPGRSATSSVAQAARVRASIEAELLATPGVIGLGYGLCCGHAQTPPACVQVMLQTHTTPLDLLAASLTKSVAALDAGCLGVEVTAVGLPGPRCDSALATCEPISMCDQADQVCCPQIAPYERTKERHPLDAGFEEFSDGICDGDGDCFLNGCGNHCTSTDTPGFFAPCPCLPALSTAHCGCVSKKCQWFTQ